MSRIGIMGGTFDPIHNGHLRLAHVAYTQYQLNSVWFMPSGQPPHKKDHKVTDPALRCEMVRRAIADYPYFSCSDFEIRRLGNTYTAQTLELLKREHPKDDFYFIIGADSLYEIENWYCPGEVMARAVLLVAGREYPKAHRPMEEQILYLKERYHAKIGRLNCEQMDIASADIREMASKNRSIESLVPGPVADYIRTHRLYASL
ncbi:MAG: nicotinate-nucleotide adenylyltransferase [Lachnospiraceae bacterium]|nr:nicotinate-nucleotide adenylyltransferase [Lachnospiraceae bacterium]